MRTLLSAPPPCLTPLLDMNPGPHEPSRYSNSPPLAPGPQRFSRIWCWRGLNCGAASSTNTSPCHTSQQQITITHQEQCGIKSSGRNSAYLRSSNCFLIPKVATFSKVLEVLEGTPSQKNTIE